MPLSEYLLKIMYEVLVFYYGSELEISTERVRQVNTEHFYDDTADTVSRNRFKEMLFLEINPVTASVTNINPNNKTKTVEFRYRTTLTFVVSDDFLDMKSRGKKIEDIASKLFVIPMAFTKKTKLNNMQIVHDRINFRKNTDRENIAELECLYRCDIKDIFPDEEIDVINSLIFDLKIEEV